MFERLTPAARRSVVAAQEEARALRSITIGPEHLLLGVLTEGTGTACDLLTSGGLTASRARDDLRRVAGEPSLLSDADAAALRTIGIDVDEVLRRVEETFGPDALATPAPSRRRPAGHIPFTPPAKKVLELALREALALKDSFIGVDHFVLAMIRQEDSLAITLMSDAGVDLDALSSAVRVAARSAS